MNKEIKPVFNQTTLNRKGAYLALKAIIEDVTIPQSQIASFLTVFSIRKPLLEEVLGFRDYLIEVAKIVHFDADTIDLCGTGGDNKNTFNISTLASFVVAGAGYKVTKHGNYSFSSISGSSTVLEHLGYRFTNDNAELKKQLDNANICYLHAPLFHSSLKKLGLIRKELGFRTVVNLLGPLLNPALPKYQCTGVFNLESARIYQNVFDAIDTQYSIIHNLIGYDEAVPFNYNKVITPNEKTFINLSEFNFKKYFPEDIEGGENIIENAAIFTSILNNKTTEAKKNTVLLNSAIAIKTIEKNSLKEAFEIAKESLESGKALHSFNTLIKVSNS